MRAFFIFFLQCRKSLKNARLSTTVSVAAKGSTTTCNNEAYVQSVFLEKYHGVSHSTTDNSNENIQYRTRNIEYRRIRAKENGEYRMSDKEDEGLGKTASIV
jgi:hypothetical protein